MTTPINGRPRIGRPTLSDLLGGSCMYKVLLRNNETGEERWVKYDMPWEEHSYFMWTDGNYGCDCNRHLFFERAGGREPDGDDGKCGSEKYVAVCAELQDGTRHDLDA